MLKVGDSAPAFVARGNDGSIVSLSALRGRPVIVYFFPKAFTPTCTIETKGFRDNYAELQSLGFAVVGISTDSEEAQCRFAEKLGVTYPMIGDPEKAITRSYDVMWPLIPFARRVAYVLDETHTVVAAFWHEFQANRHLDEILRFARTWREQHASAR